MQTSAAGNLNAPTLATACAALPSQRGLFRLGAARRRNQSHRTNAGFTLLELLVVLAIVALAAAGVGFAMRDSSQVQLEREAERLAALLESARARSRVTGVPVSWRASADGFHFEGLASAELPERWLEPGTGVADPAASLLLGPEPIIGAQELVLITASEPGKRVRLATDGVRPFAVLSAAP